MSYQGLGGLISLFPWKEAVSEGAKQGEAWAQFSEQVLHSGDPGMRLPDVCLVHPGPLGP